MPILHAGEIRNDNIRFSNLAEDSLNPYRRKRVVAGDHDNIVAASHAHPSLIGAAKSKIGLVGQESQMRICAGQRADQGTEDLRRGFSIDLHQVHQPFSFSTVEREMEAMADLVAAKKKKK